MNATTGLGLLTQLTGLDTDLPKQLAFYAAYHSDPINQLIHVIFVPLIWSTAVLGVAYSPKLFRNAPFWANYSLFVYLAYATYYAAIDFETAMIVDVIYLVLFLIVNKIVDREKQQAIKVSKAKSASGKATSARPSYKAAKWALFLHVLGWYAQIHPGHAIFEGRKPALLDSFVQSLTLAPLFVFYEMIWFFMPGYRADLREDLNRRVAEIQAAM